MPIQPEVVDELLTVYDALVETAGTLTEAAAKIAPAAVAEVLCKSGNFLDFFPDDVSRIFPPFSIQRNIEDLGGVLQRACRVPPPLPAPIDDGFLGGQCPGVAYRVFAKGTGVFQGTARETTGTTAVVNPGFGPISSSFTGTGNAKNWRINFFNASGSPVVADNGINEPSTFWTNRDWSITRIERVDGLPDDCDRPPPVYPPQPPIPDLPESPIIPDGRPDAPPGGGFIFKPTVGPIIVGPRGEITVPVVINIGGPSLSVPITIPVNVNLPDFKPTVVIGGGGGIAPPGTPRDPDSPPVGPDIICCRPIIKPGTEVGGDEDDPPETPPPPEGTILTGVRVRSIIDGARATATRIFGDEGIPDLWVPRLGSCYFKVEVETESGETVEVATADYDVKTTDQYIAAPPNVRVVAVAASPGQGVTMTLQPLYIRENP